MVLLHLMERSFYFSSNRPGGEGELDIWVSERTEDGKWSEPVNCGDIINTPYNEDTPFFDPANRSFIVQLNRTYQYGRI